MVFDFLYAIGWMKFLIAPIIALNKFLDMLLESYYDTVVNFLYLLLIAGRATTSLALISHLPGE